MTSRDDPGPRYRELVALYRRMHEAGDVLHGIPPEKTFSGQSLSPHVERIASLVRHFGARTLIDYGCGKALAYRMPKVALPGRMVFEGPLKDFWRVDDVTLYDPGFAPFAAFPAGPADGVICTDVLEHLAEDDAGWVIDEIFGLARRFVFCSVACFPAMKSLPTGENAHVTLKSVGWWADLFEAAAARHKQVRYMAAYTLADGRGVEISG
ncbi:MAG: class I SAM-dependent methyltransferase [Alphaproteobacteria bacterium]|nr:class I SAM-dependent methyltransferase [Alphaproteobacteria bacterium]